MLNWLVCFIRRSRGNRLVTAQHELRTGLLKTLAYLLAIFAVHIGLMRFFEGMTFSDALWLTLTTVTTVGYGDISATTLPGRTATVLLLYLGGIFVLAKMAGDYFDFRTQKRLCKIRGEWIWKMQGHILIINSPARNGVQYFSRLIQQFRISDRYRDHPIQILTRRFPDGLPESLSRLGSVVHFCGQGDEPEDLGAVNAREADRIVILAPDDQDRSSDSLCFDVLHRLKALEVEGKILAECVDDRNRQRLIEAGADIVLRPVRSYPEMIVRGFVAPGSEQIIENMFTSSRDEYLRYEIAISGLPWKEIVWRMISNDFGTAVAYVSSEDGILYDNAPADQVVEASALILMVREENRPDPAAVKKVLLD